MRRPPTIILCGSRQRGQEIADRRNLVVWVWPAEPADLELLGAWPVYVDLATLDKHPWAEQMRAYFARRLGTAADERRVAAMRLARMNSKPVN